MFTSIVHVRLSPRPLTEKHLTNQTLGRRLSSRNPCVSTHTCLAPVQCAGLHEAVPPQLHGAAAATAASRGLCLRLPLRRQQQQLLPLRHLGPLPLPLRLSSLVQAAAVRAAGHGSHQRPIRAQHQVGCMGW